MILRHALTSHHMNFLTEVFEGFFVTILITILVTIFVTHILLRKQAPDSMSDESDLALVPAVEELWEGALLDGVDPVVVEPRAVRRNDDVVSLE